MTDRTMQKLAIKLAESIKTQLHMMATMDLDIAAKLQREVERGNIKTFADLHEVMDANDLGTTDEIWQRVRNEISDRNYELVAGGKMTLQEAEEQFEAFTTPLCFIGHTHVPVLLCEDMRTFTMKRGLRYLINVGSVGQPRDGNPHLSFGILDTEAWTYRNVRAEYDIRSAAESILKNGLPGVLADRLFKGM